MITILKTIQFTDTITVNIEENVRANVTTFYVNILYKEQKRQFIFTSLQCANGFVDGLTQISPQKLINL